MQAWRMIPNIACKRGPLLSSNADFPYVPRYVFCDTNPFSGRYVAEVSLNKQQYTSDRVRFRFYEEPKANFSPQSLTLTLTLTLIGGAAAV